MAGVYRTDDIAKAAESLADLAVWNPATDDGRCGAANDPAAPAGAAVFPSIMTADALEATVEARWQQERERVAQKEKPDPWPILESAFPRIASVVRDKWGKRALDEYFAKLVVDDRGGRQGFPPDVLSAIMEIARLHGEQHRFSRPMCPWEVDVRETKWWNRR
ncbi:MAG: hypothetical protein MUC55_06590 [Burkholderiales bacterium]|nr:hypothetical protein [Burkholderiales bacterium]